MYFKVITGRRGATIRVKRYGFPTQKVDPVPDKTTVSHAVIIR
jgi:hypothetical protein